MFGLLPVVPMTIVSALLMVVVSRLTASSRPRPQTISRYFEERPGVFFSLQFLSSTEFLIPIVNCKFRRLLMANEQFKSASPLTPVQWLICAMAAIGFAFDIYEILMLPLIVRPALLELTGAVPGSPEFQMWVGRLFYIPAFAGGIFGLLGGYLTDLFGRRRVLTFSILIYAVSAFASGFATSIEMLLFFRCLVFIGVCVEFVAAVAWLAELFTEPGRREKVLGYTQAFSSIGGLLVATVNGLCVTYAASLPAIARVRVDARQTHTRRGGTR